MQHARNRIRDMTGRNWACCGQSASWEVNRFLLGWAGHFRCGNSSQRFDKIRSYALLRIASKVASTSNFQEVQTGLLTFLVA
ncbi:group II intron maturase-specific domain-containing protein [Nocardia sp. NPDC059764]|uniref:group II intron maturase-specific domain-containing protein n=1 Tax=Nocardia sp. NPDC059764 TaxID=3346939 RepID=UPI003647290D